MTKKNRNENWKRTHTHYTSSQLSERFKRKIYICQYSHRDFLIFSMATNPPKGSFLFIRTMFFFSFAFHTKIHEESVSGILRFMRTTVCTYNIVIWRTQAKFSPQIKIWLTIDHNTDTELKYTTNYSDNKYAYYAYEILYHTRTEYTNSVWVHWKGDAITFN